MALQIRLFFSPNIVRSSYFKEGYEFTRLGHHPVPAQSRHDSVVPSLSCASQTQFSFAILVNTHAVAHEIAVAPPTTGIADTASGKPFLRPASAHGISSPNYQGNSSRKRTSLSLIPLAPSKDFKDQPPLLISSKPITNAALAPAALLTIS